MALETSKVHLGLCDSLRSIHVGLDGWCLWRPHTLFLCLGDILSSEKIIVVRSTVGIILAVTDNGSPSLLNKQQVEVGVVQQKSGDFLFLVLPIGWLNTINDHASLLSNDLLAE